MSAPTSPAQPRPKRARKSIAHFPNGSNLFDQDNGGSSKTQDAKAAKKSRSKSLGPGGLEMLKEGDGNKQKILPVIRSILKPTIPLSPPKPIPPRTPKTASPEKNATTASPTRRSSRISASPLNPNKLALPKKSSSDDQAALVALRTEEEQQKAARDRERQEAIRRRDERRKSLANRRVSFAPEATLHTWNVVEINEDATTSSEATNATRWQSNLNNTTSSFTQGTQHAPVLDPDPPSTPQSQESDGSSPAHQRDLHQKKRRRSSAIPPMNAENEDIYFSPTSSMADDTTQQSFISGNGDLEDEDDEDDMSETDTYRDDESTAMDIDEDEIEDDSTSRTSGSGRADVTSSTSSSGQLDARLRQAATQANTQNLDLPDLEQMQQNENLIDLDFESDQQAQQTEEDDGMEMTEAVGGIWQNQPSSPFDSSPVKPSPKRRSSRGSRRRSSGANTTTEDETMEFTTALGGIRRGSMASRRESGATVATEDEDMSMEMTNVVGGVLDRIIGGEEQEDEQDGDAQPDLTAQMDVTAVYGRILSPVTERTEPSTENSVSMDFTTAVGAIQKSIAEPVPEEDATATMTMDVTKAIGSILPNELRNSDRETGRMLMQEETEHGLLARSPLVRQPSYPELPTAPLADSSIFPTQNVTTTPSQSPEVYPTTPQSNGRQLGPVRDARTPTQQMTPQPVPRPTTPSKTPPNPNVAMRRTSPRKLFSQSTRERGASTASPATGSASKRQRRVTVDPANLPEGPVAPVQPLAGTGVDQAGLGSPLVAELLDRRSSIGESAETFTPKGSTSRGVRFDDPRELERDVDRERENDLHRESGRDLLERETDAQPGRGEPTSLLDMIQSLTPKKKPNLKGRKSLAVGSALGLLGKRPAELDEDEDEDSPKRLKGPDHSPVKSVRLPAPPSKEETTGRLGKLGRVSLGPISGNIGTPKTSEPTREKASTPKDQTRFRDAGISSTTAPPVSFNQRDAGISPEPQQEAEDDVEPIHLQEFLNLINVRFMDLETSKRRHTIVPSGRTSTDSILDERRLDDCVAASVGTVPMLELYQHSCRELKKYISEGRNIVREIEQDTYEENPALFREYLSAAPDMRAIMDNQFKNVKSHARLLSRGMWYEWRMKLLEGLKDGLVKIGENLDGDAKTLSKQEEQLKKAVPRLLAEHEELKEKESRLQQYAEELASCDQDELKEVREELRAADAELSQKQRILDDLRAQKESHEAELARLTERKQQCITEIETARKLNDEYRGWKHSEVASLKAEVDALEASSGWTVATAEADGQQLLLSYRRAVTLQLKPASFQPASAESSPTRLSLMSDTSENGDAEPTTQQRFFLQLLRARLAALDQASTPVRDVLKLVARGWDLATRLQSSVSDLALGYVTDVAIVDDETIVIDASILLRAMRTRVRTRFELCMGGVGTALTVKTRTAASVVYGEELKEGRMGEFLATRIGVIGEEKTADSEQDKDEKEASASEATSADGFNSAGFRKWAAAVRELESRLIARGSKKDKPVATSVPVPVA